MVLQANGPSKGLAKRSQRLENDPQVLTPITAAERAILDRVAASPVIQVPIDQLRVASGHARRHDAAKVTGLGAAIRRFGIVEPILVDQDHTIISGAARWSACRAIGATQVPVIVLSHLSGAEIRALRIAMGRFPEWASWDRDQLRIELPAIITEIPDLVMEEIGFSVPEFDRLVALSANTDTDPADTVPPTDEAGPPVSRTGDLWGLGQHLVLCGNALDAECYDRLLGSNAVRLVLTDPPYNVPVNGHVTKRIGKFAEFAMGSGELTDEQFHNFLRSAFQHIAQVSVAGAIGYIFIDWRHARLMQDAADGVLFELKNHIVWVKDSPGLGTFYRSQHEFVLVYKIADGKHINNFQLGQHGRTRSNVWQYAGMSSFGAGRDEALQLHATPKPVAMLVDAILDCSNPGDLVLDPFGGAGSTLIAAERAHRRARLIEISPAYVDTIVRRWELFTGEAAILAGTNETFAEVAQQRRAAESAPVDRASLLAAQDNATPLQSETRDQEGNIDE